MSPDRPIDECYWVQEGLFLAGEYPGDPSDEKAREKVEKLYRAGIRTFINLTEKSERLKPYTEYLPDDTEHFNMPIRDVSVPESPEYLKGILDRIEASITSGRPVYVHCLGGVGRTGLVVGCWLVRHGETGPGALARLAEHWKTVPKSRRLPFSPETERQRKWILDWNETRSV